MFDDDVISDDGPFISDVTGFVAVIVVVYISVAGDGKEVCLLCNTLVEDLVSSSGEAVCDGDTKEDVMCVRFTEDETNSAVVAEDVVSADLVGCPVDVLCVD